MPRVSSTGFLAAALALVLFTSCERKPTEPTPAPTMHRTVTVEVRDSLGARIADAGVTWVAQFDSAGIADVRGGLTDAEGAAIEVLAEGPWLAVATSPSGTVAGATFQVSGASRAAADTQLVRLVLHTASSLTGIAVLAGRTEHSGTLVTAMVGDPVVTDSTGAWTIQDVPVGRWSLTMFHLGFDLGLTHAVVTTPGSEVAVPTVTLVSNP